MIAIFPTIFSPLFVACLWTPSIIFLWLKYSFYPEIVVKPFTLYASAAYLFTFSGI